MKGKNLKNFVTPWRKPHSLGLFSCLKTGYLHYLRSDFPTTQAFMHTTRRQDRRATLFYLLLLTLFIAGLWATAAYIDPLFSHSEVAHSAAPSTLSAAYHTFLDGVQHHMGSTIGTLLLQIVIILTVARLVGHLFSRIGQPTVIGEIVAGIMLGPSLLGMFWPEAYAWLFPAHSLASIELLSQFGLILFMFTIGMELSLGDIKKQWRHALIISQAGIYIPFLLGIGLSIFTYERYAREVAFFPLALFIGIAMSITAFPVLARIIQERRMNRTHLGKLALNTAAAGDIVAWLLLAAIMAVTQSGSFLSALYNFLFLLLYMGGVFFVAKPLFSLIGRMYNKEELVTKPLVALIFILLLLSSYLTEILSMHALFGAFMLGLVMPEDIKFRHVLTEKVEDVSLNIFLPLFFVSSGLRTDLWLINSPELWLVLVLFVLVAIAGKVGGTYISARICGLEKRESLYLGAFMNTRGLMELVVLKIGLDLGVLPMVIFAILVLMTLVTTVMTAPLIHFIDWVSKLRERRRKDVHPGRRVLISFGRSETGALLIDLANQLFTREKLMRGLSLMHVTMRREVSVVDEETFYQENFSPVLAKGKHLGIPLIPIYRVSEEAVNEILSVANDDDHDFLLVGAGLNLSGSQHDKDTVQQHRHLSRRWKRITHSSLDVLLSARNLFNDKMAQFEKGTQQNLGVFVNRSFVRPKRILVIEGKDDSQLLESLALNMATVNNARPFILPLTFDERETVTVDTQQAAEKGFAVLPAGDGVTEIPHYDFLFISYETWALLSELRPEVIDLLPSMLIVRARQDLPSTTTEKTVVNAI